MTGAHEGVALVVGIDYVGGAANRLEGAVNDARAFAELLVDRFDFAAERVYCLLEEDATRQGIERGFRRHLAGLARAGCPAVFFFAGHGTRVHAPHLRGEPDLYDEALVPVDRKPRDGRGPDILDDTLRHWLDEVRSTGAAVVVVLDCCHSGTATRDDTPTGRALAPFEGPLPERLPPFQPSPGACPGPLVVLSASADRQTAQECRRAGGVGPSHGVFTRCLLEILGGTGVAPTWREVHDRLLPAVRAINPRQTPQLEGDGVDRVAFGDETRRLAGQYRLSREGDGWRIEAGALHGLGRGSTLEVIPLGQAHPSGRVEVVEASLCTSLVDVIGGVVPSPARVRLAAAEAPFDVRLYVPPALDATVSARLVDCAHVERTGLEVADLRLVGPPTALTLASPQIVSPAPFGLDALPSALRRWSTWFGLRRLRGGLIDIDLRLCRRDETRPRDDSRPVVLAQGDVFIVKASNRSAVGAHIAILELADDGAISVRDWVGSTAPGWQARADQPIAPGQTVFLAGRATLPSGRDHDRCVFVAIATLTATRFHGLASDESRADGDDPAGSMIDRIARHARPGGGSLESRAFRWGVAQAVYETHREVA